MTSSILLFNEHIADASRWATRTATDTSLTLYGNGGFPLSNIFTSNPMQFGQAVLVDAADTVQIDLSLVDASTPPPLLGNAGACWGFLNCHAVNNATGALLDLRVRIQESNVAITGPYYIDKTHDIFLQEFQNAAARQTWFLRDMLTPYDPAASPVFANRGGNANAPFVRLTFSNRIGVGVWNLRIGRIVRMAGLLCDIAPTPQRTGIDQSEVVRSYSGTPFPLAGSRLRRYTGKTVGLTDRQIEGVFFAEPAGGTNFFRPSLNVIATTSGRSREVCIIERYGLPDSSSRWQQQPVFGLFEDDIVISRVASTLGGSDGLSEAAFSILERPQFTA